jgi:hypothetical protein
LRSIQRWRKYERELQSLVRNLETERAKLQNVCEKLLVGLVPPSRIEAMVNDPMGSLWLEAETQKKIRARVWRSWPLFQDTTKSMQLAIEELMEKLKRPVGSDSIAKGLKRATFTLNRSQYAELLSTIRDGVSSLESLTTTNMELEPQRRIRSRIRLLSILRDLSVSMYRAIRSSFRCTCEHGVGMRLTTWSADIIPGDGEEDIVGDIKFHLALSYHQRAQESSLLWEHVAVEPRLPPTLALSPAPAPTPTPTQTPAPLAPVAPNTVSGIMSAKKKFKSVRWSGFQSQASSTTTTLGQSIASITTAVSNMALASTTTSTTTSSCTSSSTSTLDLCVGIKDAQKGKQKEGHCYGTIFDNLAPKPRYFAVCPYNQLGVGLGSCRLVSLRDILAQQSGIPPLTLRDRLQLAVHTASSVLQLYETPWLPNAPGSGDIFFAVWGDCPYYGHAFVMAGSGSSPKDNSAQPPPSIIRSPTLLALGILLIEIIRGQTIDALRTAGEKAATSTTSGSGSGLPDLLADYVTASRLLSDIYQASSNYGSAVRRCIDAQFPRQKKLDLADEDFRQEVYSGVVALLEEDLSFA